MVRTEFPTATRALFLPRRRASRRKLAEEGVGPAQANDELAEGGRQPWVALAGRAALLRPGGLPVDGSELGPRHQMCGRREHGHVQADLGNEFFGGPDADAGDLVEPLHGVGEGLAVACDRGVQSDEGLGEGVDASQHGGAQQRVVVTEVTGQGLAEPGELGAHRSTGHLRQHLDVTLAGDQRLQHLPSRDPEQVGDHRVQLDLGVLEHLLQPRLLPGPFPHQSAPVTGQVPEPTDLCGWTKLGRHMPASTTLASQTASSLSVCGRPGTF